MYVIATKDYSSRDMVTGEAVTIRRSLREYPSIKSALAALRQDHGPDRSSMAVERADGEPFSDEERAEYHSQFYV